jgi:hypothetical protein
MSVGKVISQLPSAGLGNKLFSWALGALIANKSHKKHAIYGLTRFHIGVWLRREKSSRFYRGYFKNEKRFSSYRESVRDYTINLSNNNKADYGSIISDAIGYKGNVVVKGMPHWSDLFGSIRENREEVVKLFWSDLDTQIKQEVDRYVLPVFSVHIRMGDFRKLAKNEDFKNVGAVRTPLDYFIDIITFIRKELESDIPFTIFSDGSDKELEPVLALKNVRRASDARDIVHLAAMSKSKLIITSAGSTFSYWSAFLSSAIVINHFQHIHTPIRNNSINEQVFEGGVDVNSSYVPQSLSQSLAVLKKELTN